MLDVRNLLLTCFDFGMWNVFHKFISNVINKGLVIGLLNFLHILHLLYI